MNRPSHGLNRREFVGVFAICGCGMSAAGTGASDGVGGQSGAGSPSAPAQQAQPEPLAKQWVATLLPLLASADPGQARSAIRKCFDPHFRALALEPTLDKFRGDVAGFVRHLEKEWGWVVDYSPEKGIVLIDENKTTCVCPVVPKQHAGGLGILCYCSEGIAERMFSHVAGAPVRAEVVASILRGDRTCKYRIDLKP